VTGNKLERKSLLGMERQCIFFSAHMLEVLKQIRIRRMKSSFILLCVCAKNPNIVGISEIIITDEGGNECVIGAYLDRN